MNIYMVVAKNQGNSIPVQAFDCEECATQFIYDKLADDAVRNLLGGGYMVVLQYPLHEGYAKTCTSVKEKA